MLLGVILVGWSLLRSTIIISSTIMVLIVVLSLVKGVIHCFLWYLGLFSHWQAGFIKVLLLNCGVIKE